MVKKGGIPKSGVPKVRVKRNPGAAIRATMGNGRGNPSPFTNSAPGSEARAFIGADNAVGAAVLIAAFVTGGACCSEHADLALADFYRRVVGWVIGMQRDGVDVPVFLERLRKTQKGQIAIGVCVAPPTN